MGHTVIVGAGVIGLTSALELLGRGERVTLVDAAEHEGLGTSFANAGLLTPSMSDPWNAPGVHRQILEYLLSPSSAIKLRITALPSLWKWGPQFLLGSRPSAHRAATLANFELATYSLTVLAELRRQYGLSFDQTERGALKFFRSAQALDSSLAMTRFLEQHGLEATVLDRSDTVRKEPCLAPIGEQILGAIFFPEDATGDAHLFCRVTAQAIRDLGGGFRFGRPVDAIVVRDRRVRGLRLDDEFLPADQVVIAAGVDSPALASRLGLSLAIKPVKGYSMTYIPPADAMMPRLAVVDDAYHSAITPLGGRLRVAGTAEFAGKDLRLEKRRVTNLVDLLQAVYPQMATSAMLARGKPWAGLRPVAADGRPYIGPAPVSGLWVNCGHGHLGWTLAAGSARLLVDLMNGARPRIDAEPFAPGR